MSVLFSVLPQVNNRLWVGPIEDEETFLLKAEEQVFQFKQSIRTIKAPKPVGIVDRDEEEEQREPPDLQQEPDEDSNPQEDEEEEQVTEERSQSLEVEDEDNEQIDEAIFDDEVLARQMHLQEQYFGEEESLDIPEQQFIDEEEEEMVIDED